MARAGTKKERKLMAKWLMALTAVAAVMTGIVLLLQTRQTQPPTPEPTTPTAVKEEFHLNDQGFLASTTRASIPGIDVSHHQGTIDWPQVAQAGVEFAIIRLGYRSYQDGLLHEDRQVHENLAGARAAGLKIGAYFFSQATTEAEALEEAQFALEILGETALDLPLVFDWEYVSDSVPTAQVDGQTLMACLRRFCSTVEQAGQEPMVYFNQDLARTLLDLEALEYPFWLAKYTDDLDYPYEVRCWQYTDQGRIPGIQENVDIDLYFP